MFRGSEFENMIMVFNVQMFINSYVQRLNVQVFRCSKASRKCSKYQLSLQMSSIWELYLMTQNARRDILQVFWTRLEELSCPRITMTDANLMKPPILQFYANLAPLANLARNIFKTWCDKWCFGLLESRQWGRGAFISCFTSTLFWLWRINLNLIPVIHEPWRCQSLN